MPKDERESCSCVWDVTVPAKRINVGDLRKHFATHCKKYTFQLERGESGYEHYQCRVSLKTKSRKSSLIQSAFTIVGAGFHLSVTSTANKDNDFYVLKEDTRIDRPWSDKDKAPLRTVTKMENAGLYPWQTQLIEETKGFDDRSIHILIDNNGNIGKSALCKYMYMKHNATIVPP